MADLSNTKDITTVDSTPSVAITDKIYINKGGKLQQVSLSTAIESKIDSSLSKSKFAADAKATKDAISKVDSDIKAQNPISETIFSNTVTFSPTAYGNAIPEQIEGDIKQDTTKGLQLFDANNLVDYHSGTHVVIKNGKEISTTGKLVNSSTKSSSQYEMQGEVLESLKGKTIYVYAEWETENGWVECGISSPSGNKYPKFVNKQFIPIEVPSDVTKINIALVPNAKSETEETTVFKNVWVGLNEYDRWEPYTGGQPSPNPDYPQIVHGVGDMGFFDGELLQGYYQVSDGTFKPATVALCNKNPIPCKPGDKIIFEYEDVINGSGISIFFYKSDGTFISRVNKVGVRKIEGVAPQDTTYCNIVINPVSEPIPVASAKHITVTINDKYAVCVKSKGKNLLNLTGEILYSFGRETIFDNQVTINPTTDGRTAPGVWFILGDIKKFLGKTIYVKADAIQRSGNYNPRMLLMTIKGNTSVRTYLTYSYSKAGQVMSVKIPDDLDTNEASDLALNMYVNDGSSQVDTDAYAIFTNVYAGLSEPTNEFVPYQSNVTYIPVDYPLFEGDKIVRRNGEYKLLRKWGFKTYDGSDDEDWKINYIAGSEAQNAVYNVYIGDMANDAKKERYVPCNYFFSPAMGYYLNTTYVSVTGNYNIIISPDMKIDTDQKWKDWLKTHIMYCAYELATPTEEPLSPEAVKALYSIMACDEETELTIVGVPSDEAIQNQFLLPRNEDGALNTTAYCTAKRNEIALEELVAQSLDARVNKLEVDNESLNLQTLIVE